LVVWDADATRVISSKTHRQNIDFNIFEGRKVKGLATHTISAGRTLYKNGDLLKNRKGLGSYVKCPTYLT
jgi:dihydropyrimidinase